MTLIKRLSMTGAIVTDEPDVGSSFGQSIDNDVSVTSGSSVTMEVVQKIPYDESPQTAEPPLQRRRRSCFGNLGGPLGDSGESSDKVDEPKTTSSRRRRSLPGSSAPDRASKQYIAPKNRSSPKLSRYFGSATKPKSDSTDERSESTVSSGRTPTGSTSHRLYVSGASVPTLDDTIGRKPPRPTKSFDQSDESSLNDSSRLSMNSAPEARPRSPHRGLYNTKSLDLTAKKEKNHLNRGNGLGVSVSFHSTIGKSPDRPPATSCEKDVLNAPSTPQSSTSRVRRFSVGKSSMPSPGTPNASQSHVRRFSFGNDAPPPPPSPGNALKSHFRRFSFGNEVPQQQPSPAGSITPKILKSFVRRFSFGNDNAVPPSPGGTPTTSTSTPTSKSLLKSYGELSSSPSPSHQTTTTSSDTTTTTTTPSSVVNPYTLVNHSRTKRGLPEFSRNMLMDTLAKRIAIDLAETNGGRCTPTKYHGNIGQGESIEKIHRKMMKQKQETARSNILSVRFSTIGIGIAKDKDGLFFLCQLFE